VTVTTKFVVHKSSWYIVASIIVVTFTTFSSDVRYTVINEEQPQLLRSSQCREDLTPLESNHYPTGVTHTLKDGVIYFFE